MLKDDRMMSMLTFVVIMIAVGTLIQRVDVLERYFGGGSVALELQHDEVIVRANSLSSIDVLANDLGLRSGDAKNLFIAEQPDCGRVFVRKEHVQYLPSERCAGSQTFKYAISGRGDGLTGEVIVLVRLGEPAQSTVAANAQRDVPTPAPMVPRATEQRVNESPALLAAQPAAGADPGSAVVHAPAAPRPQSPAIGGLPDTASGAGSATVGNGGSIAAGVTLDGSGHAPNMTAPAGGMAEATGTAAAPAVTQPGPEAPGSEAPGPQPPALPATVLPTPGQPNPGRPNPGLTNLGLAEPMQPAPLPAGSTAADTSSGTATVALAEIGPAPLADDDTAAPRIQRDIEGHDANVPRADLSELGTGGSGQPGSGQSGLGQPADVLASVRALGEPAELAPVDTTAPTVLPEPGAALAPDAANRTSAPPDAAATRVAALPSPATPCIIPPALILDVKPAGLTEVIVESSCHANSVAELSYDGLRLGVALDAAGAGAIAAVGLQQASDATLRFADNQTVSFNIPFADTERIERVAMAWEMPVDLELHAFEFGALPEDDGHVGPAQPRSYGDVRRRGGGYLLEYQPVGGVGQNVQVYTYWRRHGGRSGVVKLAVDFASRGGQERPDTCSGGALSEPDFTVLRSVAGNLERPHRRRLASLDCAAVAGGVAGGVTATAAGSANRYIGDAVEDLIVLQR